ncbi:hypothetical protein PCL1606_57510 [Pseudomonas chlororaphis]|uniref:Uncharacterized protein n=1 Tax=Pseudomonas chlororaphis TaxID=587753 RepID=A0A0D5Y842_9PSED|nr:hypothetical protein PCL1606_57510 [Pseudomonas chlororaphis]
MNVTVFSRLSPRSGRGHARERLRLYNKRRDEAQFASPAMPDFGGYVLWY